MNHIEKLIRRAIEKNISAKPICGNYRIDIEYVIGGVIYTIIKKDMRIATIGKVLSYKSVSIAFTPITEDSDMDRVHSAIEHCFKDCEIKIL